MNSINSIPAKVTLWSIAALVISLAVFIFVVNDAIKTSIRADFEQFSRVLFHEAVATYQSEGSSGLSRYLRELNRQGGTQFHLTDSRGRDLETGDDRSTSVRKTIGQHREIDRERGQFTIAIASNDGKFIWLVYGHPPSLASFAPFYLLLLATVATLYGLITIKIAAPLRRLTLIVERFGDNELTARADTRSKDEVGNLGRSFNMMAERIHTLLNAERQLLQDVSHELRSPLARLTFEAEMVRKTTDRDAAAVRLRREIERLSELVGTLIDMARAEGEPGTIEITDFSLNELLQSTVEDCEMEAAARGCELFLAFSDVVEFRGDEELLRRALENVVRNAVRYAPSGTRVEVSMHRKDGNAVITVRDQGPGIPVDLVEKIFDPFFRVDSSREEKTGGLGLGLAIARRAVRVHHGDIVAEAGNPGALMRITLPVNSWKSP
jgi:two-component system sensor histidine kinase CpxA